MANMLLLLSAAWGQEVCSDAWMSQRCDVTQSIARLSETGFPLLLALDYITNEGDGTTGCVIVDDVIPDSNALSTFSFNDSDLVNIDLVLKLEGDGALPASLEMDGRADICPGSRRCYIGSLTICHAAEDGPPPPLAGLTLTAQDVSGGDAFTLHGLRLEGAQITTSTANLSITDTSFVDSNVRIHPDLIAELTRVLACGTAFEVAGNSNDPDLLLVSSLLSQSPLAATGAGLSLWNNHLLAGSASHAVQLTDASTLSGGNNLFWGGGVDLDASTVSGWSHNALLAPRGGATLHDAGAIDPGDDPLSGTLGSFACAALVEAWPLADRAPAAGLLPDATQGLVVAGTPFQGTRSSATQNGQPDHCAPDIGAFGGTWAPAAVWGGNLDGDCLEAPRDCDGNDADSNQTVLIPVDADGDGARAEALTCGSLADRDPALLDAAVDCDEERDDVAPGLPELCDGLDNNCNVTVDEGLSATTWYPVDTTNACVDVNGALDACAMPPDGDWTDDVSAFPPCEDDDDTAPPSTFSPRLRTVSNDCGFKGFWQHSLLFLPLFGWRRRRPPEG